MFKKKIKPNAEIYVIMSVLKAVADLCHCSSTITGCSGNRKHKQQDSAQGKKFKREILPLIFIVKKLSTHLTSSI